MSWLRRFVEGPGLLDRIGAASEQRSGSVSWSSPELARLFSATPTAAGVVVTEEGALNLSAVWRCVRLISEQIAMLPAHVYRITPKGRERVRGHWLDRLFSRRANGLMDAFLRRQVELLHLLLWGRAASEIELTAGGEIVGLWPLAPERLTVTARDKKLSFVYMDSSGERRPLPEARVHYTIGLSTNGVHGLSPVGMARESLAAAMAVEQYGAAFFGNSARPSGVLKSPTELSTPAYDRLKADWSAMHQGSANAGRTAILEGGMEWLPLSLPPEDAQFLDTRRFAILEIGRWFGVPPDKLGELERATHSNIEHTQIAFGQDTLAPWCRRIEAAYNLLLPEDYYLEHNLAGLERADFETRMKGYREARQAGAVTTEEIRERENWPPLPADQRAGEVWIPLQVAPASSWESVMLKGAPKEARAPGFDSRAALAQVVFSGLGAAARIVARKLEAPDAASQLEQGLERVAAAAVDGVRAALLGSEALRAAAGIVLRADWSVALLSQLRSQLEATAGEVLNGARSADEMFSNMARAAAAWLLEEVTHGSEDRAA